ncbi:hypothetical protein [Sphingomonas bacterium]|uniref:hypothetical protein n=1 Tax=Sphingomonas bacterium TaxID=1895847 RepID=UPI00157774BD|nr:hypothetical protein [Sphingomonas bacterium]
MLVLVAMTTGTPAFESRTLSDRTKAVSSAPAGYRATWKEQVRAAISQDAADADFDRMMVAHAEQLAHDYYGGEDGTGKDTFETHDTAGSLDVYETVSAASPDIISAHAGAGYYEAGMAHPNNDASDFLIWSRRKHRLLVQNDVFAREPDAALRRKAFAAFDNKEGVDPNTAKNGLPLTWDHVGIGPDGMTWTFGPYELGGYLSGGNAMIGWADLKPYLRRDLPFVIATIRAVALPRK